jgi:hypothetical protein
MIEIPNAVDAMVSSCGHIDDKIANAVDGIHLAVLQEMMKLLPSLER